MDCIIREAVVIELHPNIMNREDGFCLNKSWKSLICFLKNHRSWILCGPNRSVYTSLIRAQNVPSPGTH
jgi:hypothetical protein